MGAKICRPVLTQSGAEVRFKRCAEPLTTTETLEDWKTSEIQLFKDEFSVSNWTAGWKKQKIRKVCDSDMTASNKTHKQTCALQ